MFIVEQNLEPGPFLPNPALCHCHHLPHLCATFTLWHGFACSPWSSYLSTEGQAEPMAIWLWVFPDPVTLTPGIGSIFAMLLQHITVKFIWQSSCYKRIWVSLGDCLGENDRQGWIKSLLRVNKQSFFGFISISTILAASAPYTWGKQSIYLLTFVSDTQLDLSLSSCIFCFWGLKVCTVTPLPQPLNTHIHAHLWF